MLMRASFVLAALLAAATAATAATPPLPSTPRAHLTVQPNPVAVGAVAHLTATARNRSGGPIPMIALGTTFPLSMSFRVVSTPQGGTCRSTAVADARLVYCTVENFGNWKKAALKVDVTAPAARRYPITSYARNLDTMEETGAATTLVAN
jgi:hypothetical protein